MVFSSPIFLICFFPVTYLVHRILRGQRARNVWLSLASLVFFAFGQLPYLSLLVGSVTADWLFGLWLLRGTGRRRLAVGLAVTAHLTLLGIFKYLGLLARTAGALTGTEVPVPELVLPIGISFYTFQGLSYVIDVYRDPSAGTRSFGKVLLYLSFFPQLIAGPIVLYRDVSEQIDRRELDPDLTLSGLGRLICGLGKKLLLADTAARAADAVFGADPASLDLRLAWLGAVCYTLQIYFDFSGYSDMAIGLGRLFGFRFRENFDLPYTAASVREFWRRWHISLSSWFRNYLYIPLGGSRRGPRRTAWNKLTVFFLTGLWHGADWTFVLWGLWHGAFSALEGRGIVPERLRRGVAGHVYTMLVVILGFVLFRAEDLGAAMGLISRMLLFSGATPAQDLFLRSLLDRRTVVLLLVSVLLAAGIPQRIWARLAVEGTGPRRRAALSGIRAAACGAVLVCSLLHMVSSSFSPFLYFQF